MEVQNRISEEDNRLFLGQTMDVLVEGRSKRSDNPVNQVAGESDGSGPVQLTGRTHCDRIVVFDGNPRLAGQIIPVGIYDAAGQTLFGTVVTTEVTGSGLVSLG